MNPDYEKLERRIQKLIESRERYKITAKNAEKALREVEVKYNSLYRSCKYMGRPNGLIIHLEKYSESQDEIIRKYQRHYAQYGHFYSDYETRKGEHNPKKESDEGAR